MRKQKVGVIIGMSSDAIYTIQTAKQMGIFVVGIDGNKDAVGLQYVDKAIVADISDLGLMEKVIEEVQPDLMIPVPIGRYFSTTGFVNSRFNLKGPSEAATVNSTDKYLFHNKLHKSGLREIKMYLIQPMKADIEVEYDITYPVILKPRYGSGSRDVHYLQSKDELNECLKAIACAKEDYILEEAVKGVEYGVDGAVINGELKTILVRKKINTPLPIRQAISSLAVAQDAPEFKRIHDKLAEVVKAMEYDDCLLQVDLMVNEKEVFCIEISPRPAGHSLHSVFVPIATDINMVEEYIKVLIGEKSQLEPKHIRTVQIRYFDFEDGYITSVPTLSELEGSGKCSILKWSCNISVGDYMNKVVDGHSIMGRGFFIVEGDSEEDLLHQSEWILNQFKMKRRQ